MRQQSLTGPVYTSGGGLFLLGVAYDGHEKKAYLKMLDIDSGEVLRKLDTTQHRPYCLSPKTIQELQSNENLKRAGAVDFRTVRKIDLLRESEVEVTQIIASDPLAVGGSKGAIRELVECWEADIPYHLNYLYDRQLVPGIIYTFDGDQAVPKLADKQKISEIMRQRFSWARGEEAQHIEEWLTILEAEQQRLEFVGLDIEIIGESPTRVPSPSNPEDMVAAISLRGSDGLKLVLLHGPGRGEQPKADEFAVESFDKEEEMLRRCFRLLRTYPVVVTFNGDEFDLPYLRNRGEKLQIPREEIPISLGREGATLRNGIHLDLYRLFNNKSIQVYAFDNRYREHTLEGVAAALLGAGKVAITKPLAELTPDELAAYSFRDAEILHDLMMANDGLLPKLLVVLSRVSRMPMEDVCRHGVSGWIKNLLYWYHRKRNFLIPRKDEILREKGEAVTKAVIKDKKYRGAIVVEPVQGVHFDVTVLDFASLYPSILKEKNLSYETVRCPHEECKTNLVPETNHWVCTKRQGIQSLIIGSLRDVRVGWYKPQAGDRSLPQQRRNWYDVVQKALKVFINASYGVFGFSEFPLYCPPAAESTAAIGRQAFMMTVEKARSLGIEVIYGDTDSVFMRTNRPQLVDEMIAWSRSHLQLELEPDKVYRYVVFSTRKKNYLGVTDKGVVEVKGLTGKKRNIPVFIKEAFDDMLRQLAEVKSVNDLETVKQNIRNVISTWYSRLRRREFKLEELAFHVMLSKTPERYAKTTPQHVKAARKLVESGIKVVAGDIISYVKTKDKVGVTPILLAQMGKVDYADIVRNIDIEKYIDYTRSTFEQVTEPLDIDMESVPGVTSLERFI